MHNGASQTALRGPPKARPGLDQRGRYARVVPAVVVLLAFLSPSSVRGSACAVGLPCALLLATSTACDGREKPAQLHVATEPSTLPASLAKAELLRRGSEHAQTSANMLAQPASIQARLDQAADAAGIEGLLERVAQSELRFVVPASDGTPEQVLDAEAFSQKLRKKWRWLGEDIRDASDWIEEIASHTYPEGLPYRFHVEGGARNHESLEVEEWLYRLRAMVDVDPQALSAGPDAANEAGFEAR